MTMTPDGRTTNASCDELLAVLQLIAYSQETYESLRTIAAA